MCYHISFLDLSPFIHIKAIDKTFLEQTILGSIIEHFNNYRAIGVPANKIRSKQIYNTPANDGFSIISFEVQRSNSKSIGCYCSDVQVFSHEV